MTVDDASNVGTVPVAVVRRLCRPVDVNRHDLVRQVRVGRIDATIDDSHANPGTRGGAVLFALPYLCRMRVERIRCQEIGGIDVPFGLTALLGRMPLLGLLVAGWQCGDDLDGAVR